MITLFPTVSALVLGVYFTSFVAAPTALGEDIRGQLGDAKTRAEALVGEAVSGLSGAPVGHIGEVMAGDDGEMMNVQIVRGPAGPTLRVPRQHMSLSEAGGLVVNLADEQLASFAEDDAAPQSLDR